SAAILGTTYRYTLLQGHESHFYICITIKIYIAIAIATLIAKGNILEKLMISPVV
ncbi:9114_t:CDS:1, partial [Racocetra fulgida]